jgi:hypothetical protein
MRNIVKDIYRVCRKDRDTYYISNQDGSGVLAQHMSQCAWRQATLIVYTPVQDRGSWIDDPVFGDDGVFDPGLTPGGDLRPWAWK